MKKFKHVNESLGAVELNDNFEKIVRDALSKENLIKSVSVEDSDMDTDKIKELNKTAEKIKTDINQSWNKFKTVFFDNGWCGDGYIKNIVGIKDLYVKKYPGDFNKTFKKSGNDSDYKTVSEDSDFFSDDYVTYL